MLYEVAALPRALVPFGVVLINPYELGRQPFALAEPAAMLKRRLKLLGKIMLGIVVLFVVFFLFERFRGQISLASYKRELI